MKDFILAHKKQFLIGAAALACLALIAALFFTYQIWKNAPEKVPEGRIYDSGVFEGDITIHDSTEGEITIGDSGEVQTSARLSADAGRLISNPDDIWTESTYAGSHTPIEQAMMADGSIGVLTIEKLGLSVNVFESPDQMEDMEKGAAHFSTTSAWDGNVGISAHNINFDGSKGYFVDLHTLKEGDTIHYKTGLGERDYVVKTVKTIDAADWSPLGYEDFNQLTLITCISGQPEQRLCVQAVEQSEG